MKGESIRFWRAHILAVAVAAGPIMGAAFLAPARAQTVPHVEAVYANPGTFHLVPTGGAADLIADFEVPVPDGSVGIVGWKLATWASDRTRQWAANATLRVGDEGYDNLKARESAQQQPHFLPSGLLILVPAAQPSPAPPRVSINVRFFDEDQSTDPIDVRANAWVWFQVQ